MIPTPLYSLKGSQAGEVYEPSEDSFLLLDALAADSAALASLRPSLCIEVLAAQCERDDNDRGQVGCGSGVVGVFLLQVLRGVGVDSGLICTDLNPAALASSADTAHLNGLAERVHFVQADLLTALKGRADVVVLNPPYVESPSEEVRSDDLLLRALSGGRKGREVTDRFLKQIPNVINIGGFLYLVAIDVNDIKDLLSFDRRFSGSVIASRRAGIEHLHILKFVKTSVDLVQQAVSLGFDSVVINIDIGELTEKILGAEESEMKPGQKKKRKTSKMKTIPDPFVVPVADLALDSLALDGRKFRQWSRLTVGLSDPDFLHALLKEPRVGRFDVLAVRPSSEAILGALSGKPGVDLIALDPSERYPWLLKGKLVGQAVERGLAFELAYASALADSSLRRTLFAQGRQLLSSLGRKQGEGLIVSSGGRRGVELRGPFDVANLLTLFGASPELGRRAISATAHRVLCRAETKRSVKGAIAVLPLQGVPKDQLQSLAKVPEFRLQIERMQAEGGEYPSDVKKRKLDDI